MSKFCHICGEFWTDACLTDVHLKHEIRVLKEGIEDVKDKLRDLKDELIEKEYKLGKIKAERVNDE